ncbi:MAG: quinohemoprotein amine dehydrogenase maturation protein [Acidobacteriota bacterium]|nr:quinohemoprotein amine dehydrogenase maturation protein [Acidobacteriota bacterium]
MQLQRSEMHRFEARGEPFVYLVPSAAVFQLDPISAAVLDGLNGEARDARHIVDELSDRFAADDVTTTLEELVNVRALRHEGSPSNEVPLDLPPEEMPLQNLVLNVTSKCNLSCGYCYEYGDDRLSEASAMPDMMSDETARQSVDLLFEEAGPSPVVHLTFFGGETLLNLRVLKEATHYARAKGAEVGKRVEIGLTTNATLLKPDVITWLIDNDIGVTVSIDGPKEMQDRFRIFQSGEGSYGVIEPKVRELLRRHRRRAIGARVTLTQQNLDVQRIFRHLSDDVGFLEVGFAPVTTSTCRDYAIDEDGYVRMLGAFEELGHEFVEATVAGRHHAFSNVKETIEEIHKGVSKAYPCGAGLGLLGVSTGGDVGLCHRFAGSGDHTLGSVTEGIDKSGQRQFLEEHHIAYKPDCHSCWARPLCSGGCYHEAQTRYGSTKSPNLHYCDWIRSWTHTCLELYGELATRAPGYLGRLDA